MTGMNDIKHRVLLGLLAGWLTMGPAGRAPAAQFEFAAAPGPGILLVARPGLPDPNFSRTVVLLVDYDEEGAFGLIINRPSRHRLAEALPEMGGLTGRTDLVYLGGPVAPQQMALLLHSIHPPENSHHVIDDIYFTMSQADLGDVLARDEETFHAFAGYAGWGTGQLDAELARGDWRLVRADASILFEHAHESIWEQLIEATEGIWVRLTPGGPVAGRTSRPAVGVG